MPRQQSVRLRDQEQPWRSVPMPGANLNLELVPLEAHGNAFTILGRFPPEFRRMEAGGYRAAEDVLVLAGRLELEDQSYETGDLVHIPAGYLRTSMFSPDGCLVLAWFSGPADFRPPDELHAVTAGLRSVKPASADGCVLATDVSRWSVVDAPDRPMDADAVDLQLTMWTRAGAEWPGAQPRRIVTRTAHFS